jgi:inosine-uridine nucleoside N-ribohydrolase
MSRTKIILDCDPGTDDAFALMLAFAAPELEVLAVTVAGGNVGLDRTLPNTLSLLALADTAIPVHPGADRPILGAFVHEQQVHGADGLSGVRLPPGLPASPELAIDAIRRILRESDQPVVLVTVARQTALPSEVGWSMPWSCSTLNTAVLFAGMPSIP